MTPQAPSPQEMERALAWVESHLGLHFPSARAADFTRGIARAAAEQGQSPKEFIAALVSGNGPAQAVQTAAMRERLAAHLTIGETYFFRDDALMEALEKSLLPRLLDEAADAGRPVRIWSAACASGEEPYTLAMLVDRVRQARSMDDASPHVSILATDINPQALARAREGTYTRWSFRNTPDETRDRYFAPATATASNAAAWRITPRIASMVRFAPLNLATDAYPSQATGTAGLDLLFARNVLMYFGRELVQQVLGKLSRCLRSGGLFFTSPSESNLATSSGHFHLLVHRGQGGDAIYHGLPADVQPGDDAGAGDTTSMHQATPVGSEHATSSPTVEDDPQLWEHLRLQNEERAASPVHSGPGTCEGVQPLLDKAEQLATRGAHEEVLLVLHDARAVCANLPGCERCTDVARLMATSLAALGRLDKAAHICEERLITDKLAHELWFLLASIELERGNEVAAREHLRRALYLQPDLALAHYMLGSLHLSRGEASNARRSLHNARKVLELQNPDDTVPMSEGMNVRRMLLTVDAALQSVQEPPGEEATHVDR